MIDVDETLKSQGIGVPAFLSAFGLLIVYGTLTGASGFETLTSYGKLGVFVLLLGAMACFFAAGWTYHAIDPEWWLLTQDE